MKPIDLSDYLAFTLEKYPDPAPLTPAQIKTCLETTWLTSKLKQPMASAYAIDSKGEAVAVTFTAVTTSLGGSVKGKNAIKLYGTILEARIAARNAAALRCARDLGKRDRIIEAAAKHDPAPSIEIESRTEPTSQQIVGTPTHDTNTGDSN